MREPIQGNQGCSVTQTPRWTVRIRVDGTATTPIKLRGALPGIDNILARTVTHSDVNVCRPEKRHAVAAKTPRLDRYVTLVVVHGNSQAAHAFAAMRKDRIQANRAFYAYRRRVASQVFGAYSHRP